MFRCGLDYLLQHRLRLDTHRPLDRNGQPKAWFELTNVPESLCRYFSKRRQAIEKQLGAWGWRQHLQRPAQFTS